MARTRRKAAVIGAGGQLGTDLCRILAADRRDEYEVVGLTSSDLDITDKDRVDEALSGHEYDVVINCAAMTNVDRCEERGDEALAINAVGAYLAARAAKSASARYVLISTDFVFDGEQTEPYDETSAPSPINVYGASKLSGEQMASISHPEALVLRISSVFGKAGSRGKGGNFVEAILSKARNGEELKVVDDLTMSPTYTVDVAHAIPDLLDARASGIVHLSNSGSCTWYEFAQRILELSGLEASIERVDSSAFPRPAKRPRNSSLTTQRLEGLIGRQMRHWSEAVRAYLEESA